MEDELLNTEKSTSANDLEDSDLEIINLEEEPYYEDDEDDYAPKKGIFRFLNVHTLLLAVIVFVVVICFFRLTGRKQDAVTVDNCLSHTVNNIAANRAYIELRAQHIG